MDKNPLLYKIIIKDNHTIGLFFFLLSNRYYDHWVKVTVIGTFLILLAFYSLFEECKFLFKPLLWPVGQGHSFVKKKKININIYLSKK